MVPTLVQGVSMAFFFIPLVSITLSGIAPERLPAASGLSNFMRITAGAVGTSIVTTVWESRAALHHAQLSEAVNPGNAAAMTALRGLEATGMSHEQALAQINRMVDHDGGRILLDGQEIYSFNVRDLRRRMGYAIQIRYHPHRSADGGRAQIMNKDLPRWATAFVMPLLNLLSALLVTALVIHMLGESPTESLQILINSAVINPEGLSYTLFYASTFIFTGLAVSIAMQAGLFNIGAEGQ
eukprot:gene19002-38168_t